MFLTFLNKSAATHADPSLLKSYTPAQVLSYYYNGSLYLGSDFFQTLLNLNEDEVEQSDSIREWINFVGADLEAFDDLVSFSENEYLYNLGPFYYPMANSRIYFTKAVIPAENKITKEDLDILENLQVLQPLNPIIQASNKSKKVNKKNNKAFDDLLFEINQCLAAFNESERLNKQLNFLRKHLDNRTAVLRDKEIKPMEPDNVPVKPQKEEWTAPKASIKSTLLSIAGKKKDNEQKFKDFNHEIKVYYIRYREYEKSCDRFKNALLDWPNHRTIFIGKCQREADKIKEKMLFVQHQLKTCNSVLSTSAIHAKYQDQKILSNFKEYLETGRASDIQACMNIYEEEKLWHELRAGQERIENTIYFMQNENEHVYVAQQHMNHLLEEKNYKELLKV